MCRTRRCLDSVGVTFPQLLGPGAVTGVELARGVALHVPRQLLQLDPEEALPLRRPRVVHRQRLPDDDRRLRREQAALGLVHRARDAVEARASGGRSPSCRGARRLPTSAARYSAKWICISDRAVAEAAAWLAGRRAARRRAASA